MPTVVVKKECVGSLLVPTSDVQELSESTATKLQKRVTAVGTLLIPDNDLWSTDPEQVNSLQRRITNKLTGPAPPDSEADTWAD